MCEDASQHFFVISFKTSEINKFSLFCQKPVKESARFIPLINACIFFQKRISALSNTAVRISGLRMGSCPSSQELNKREDAQARLEVLFFHIICFVKSRCPSRCSAATVNKESFRVWVQVFILLVVTDPFHLIHGDPTRASLAEYCNDNIELVNKVHSSIELSSEFWVTVSYWVFR